ncbi:hypothetical protein JCM19235_2119 [Vibrio maritimus]|uniref:Uncharacterized protein n=1 Tax=Vibrio maritimus TaxID=990268 RepID=A0A090RTS8_9VIBR|nr:hypothetical protein JCM19235_2119 [Vibrio maritimus]
MVYVRKESLPASAKIALPDFSILTFYKAVFGTIAKTSKQVVASIALLR